MKFGQSLAVSLAALLCTGSLALAQAPDKGGMGGGMGGGGMGGMGGGAPAEKMDRGGGGPGGAQEKPSRGMSGERGGADRGMSERGQAGERSSRSVRPKAQGRERDQDRAERGGRDQGQERAQRRDRNEDRAQRAGRDRDQDKAQRTARDKDQKRALDRDQDRAAQSGRNKDQDRAQRTDRDRDQGKTARTPDRNGQLQNANRVQASEKQHAEVRQHLLRDRKIERTRLNVAVNIGTTIPRSVRLHPISSVIIGFAPVYRGYSYVLLEDETICIVDPRTYVVVDVIPASTQRAEGPGTRTHLTLSAEERRLVLASIDKDRSADISVRLALGAEIPRSVEVETFPVRILERVPQLRSYRYVVVQDQVAIIDPDDRQVALLIND
jgi:uncharacterized protein DUF1236